MNIIKPRIWDTEKQCYVSEEVEKRIKGMNNQVAASCCGSCNHYDEKKGETGVDECRGCVRLSGKGKIDNYSPRNPIPITNIPGVKELVEKAYRTGVKDRSFWPISNANDLTENYMESLGGQG